MKPISSCKLMVNIVGQQWPSGLTRQFVRPWMRKVMGSNLGDGYIDGFSFVEAD